MSQVLYFKHYRITERITVSITTAKKATSDSIASTIAILSPFA
jgi:hypothetical protein